MFQSRDMLFLPNIPQFEGPIITAAGKQLSIWRERYGVNLIAVPSERCYGIVPQIPQFDRVVITCTGNECGVYGRELHRLNRAAVSQDNGLLLCKTWGKKAE